MRYLLSLLVGSLVIAGLALLAAWRRLRHDFEDEPDYSLPDPRTAGWRW